MVARRLTSPRASAHRRSRGNGVECRWRVRALYTSALMPWDDATRQKMLASIQAPTPCSCLGLPKDAAWPRAPSNPPLRAASWAESPQKAGLVDAIGLQTAVDRARSLAKVGSEVPAELIRDRPNLLEALSGSPQSRSPIPPASSVPLLELEAKAFLASMAPSSKVSHPNDHAFCIGSAVRPLPHHVIAIHIIDEPERIAMHSMGSMRLARVVLSERDLNDPRSHPPGQAPRARLAVAIAASRKRADHHTERSRALELGRQLIDGFSTWTAGFAFGGALHWNSTRAFSRNSRAVFACSAVIAKPVTCCEAVKPSTRTSSHQRYAPPHRLRGGWRRQSNRLSAARSGQPSAHLPRRAE